MKFTTVSVIARETNASHRPAELIADWATRVVGLWELSRATSPAVAASADDLGDACRVRDQVNNRLTQTYPGADDGSEESMEALRDADALFLQFTLRASSAEALSRHNHYARRAEWWWGRQLRPQAA